MNDDHKRKPEPEETDEEDDAAMLRALQEEIRRKEQGLREGPYEELDWGDDDEAAWQRVLENEWHRQQKRRKARKPAEGTD